MLTSGSATVDGVLVTDSSPAQLVDTDTGNTVVTIHNRVGVLFVKLGQNANSSDFTYRLNKDAILEVRNYIGPITAVTQSGAGFVDVTTWG